MSSINRVIPDRKVALATVPDQESRRRKNFLHKNEAFICKNCGLSVKKHSSSCRNHCSKCLFSLHVDLETPGDRKNPCHGLMRPIGLDQNGKKGFIILHECEKCRTKTRNKTAQDDDTETIIHISGIPLSS